MIRQDTDYALRLLVQLAEAAPRRVATAELAEGSGVPHGFAQKILRKLAAAGLLEIRSGRGGGFDLKRPLKAVSMMDVIKAIQGPLLLNRCMAGPATCVRQTSCRVNVRLRSFQTQLEAMLCSTSLADLLVPAAGPAGKGKAKRRAGGRPACLRA